MRMKSFVGLLLSFGVLLPCLAEDHVAFHVQKSGLRKLLKSTVSHYLKMKNTNSFVIEGNDLSGTISQANFQNNPIVKVMQQYVNITGDGDISYTLKWDNVSAQAGYDEDNIKITHKGSGQVFETALGIDFNHLQLTTPKVEICEYFDGETKTCDQERGFYARVENVQIELKTGSKLTAVMGMKVDASSENIQLSFGNISTNLKGERNKLDTTFFPSMSSMELAQLDINFAEFYMPPPVLRVNGQAFEMDVTQIKDVILAEREFLAGSLTGILGEFLAQDLVGIVNNVITNKLNEFKSRIALVNYNRIDHMKNRFSELSETDPRAAIEFLRGYSTNPGDEASFFEKFKYVLRSRVHKVHSYCQLERVETASQQDISLFFNSHLEVNNSRMNLSSKIHNGRSHLGHIDFEQVGHDADLSIGVSESYINGLLATTSEHNVTTALFYELFKMSGVFISGLNVHFIDHPNSSYFKQVKVVANVKVRISQLDNGDFWSLDGLSSRINNQIGSWLEDDLVWFPVELDFYLDSKQLEVENKITLIASNPFGSGQLRNTFGYPMKDMKGVVKNSIFSKLQESLEPALSEPLEIDLKEYLDAIPGVHINPKYLRLSGEGHIVLGLDFHRLDLTRIKEELTENE